MDPGFLYRYHSGGYSHPGFRLPPTDRLQLHSTWVPAQSVCGVLNSESSNKNVVGTFITDVVLLLTMLVGLLRLRRRNIMFGFGQLLWKQVGNTASRRL
jgi:hypothetical protein